MAFTDIPGRAFLDTCVVNFMLDYGAQIHDGELYPDNLSDRIISDIEALRDIYLTGQRASWQLAISHLTYEEVISTNNPNRRYYLENWFSDIWHYWQEIITPANDLPTDNEAEAIKRNLLNSELLQILPDISDRFLICDAIVYHCDCFCTRDWGTILKYRDALEDLPITILTPTEWWNSIAPYANLWA